MNKSKPSRKSILAARSFVSQLWHSFLAQMRLIQRACGGRVAAAVAQAPGTDRLPLGTVDLIAKTGALTFTSALEIHLSLLVRRARLAKAPSTHGDLVCALLVNARRLWPQVEKRNRSQHAAGRGASLRCPQIQCNSLPALAERPTGVE
jgi:hypothetical protein